MNFTKLSSEVGFSNWIIRNRQFERSFECAQCEVFKQLIKL